MSSQALKIMGESLNEWFVEPSMQTSGYNAFNPNERIEAMKGSQWAKTCAKVGITILSIIACPFFYEFIQSPYYNGAKQVYGKTQSKPYFTLAFVGREVVDIAIYLVLLYFFSILIIGVTILNCSLLTLVFNYKLWTSD